MWDAIVGFVKGFFGGGKGVTQVGNDQQAVSGSTTGYNSPVIAAGRDVHFGPTPSADPYLEVFADLEELMPDLLDLMRSDLAEHPLLRDIVYLEKSTYAYNFNSEHMLFADDKQPGAGARLRILLGHRLLTEEKEDFWYRITERFAKYLRKK